MQRYSPLARPQAVLSFPTRSAFLARCSSCVGGEQGCGEAGSGTVPGEELGQDSQAGV